MPASVVTLSMKRIDHTMSSDGVAVKFAMSDPDETLVRVGWPSSLRKSPLTVISARRGI
jgi:hypothetical protein